MLMQPHQTSMFSHSVTIGVAIFTQLLRPNQKAQPTRPCSAVGNVSGYRCVSDCKSRGAFSIPAQSHTFVEIDHEIISTDILLPSAESFKKG